MIFRVYIRPKFVPEMHVEKENHPMTGLAMTLEQELFHAEIHYQGIEIKEDLEDYIQILCRDKEEQEHLKHILLKMGMVLCFDQHHQRYFGQNATDEEKETFKK